MASIDRTNPPDYQKVQDLTFQKAESQYLDNGIPLHVIDTGTQEIVRIEIVLWYGKWNESVDASNFFTSKLLLEGTEAKSSLEISTEIDRFGAYLNITPGLDFTIISLYCIHAFVDPMVSLLHEVLNESIFPGNELERIKTIELQQLKINQEKNSFVASNLFRSKLFGENHPYGKFLTEETIQKVKRGDLLSHYRLLKKARREIIVSGLVNKSIVEKINEVFGREQFSPESTAAAYQIETASSVSKNDKQNSVQTTIRAGKLIPGKRHSDYHKLLVTNELLGGFFGSRLMKNIREDKGLTYGIYSALVSFIHGSYFVIGADVMKSNCDQALEEIYREIEILRTTVPTDKELELVKNYLMGSFQAQINTPFALADKFKSVYLFNLDYQYYQDFFETINRIDINDVQEIAENYLKEDTMTLVTVG